MVVVGGSTAVGLHSKVVFLNCIRGEWSPCKGAKRIFTSAAKESNNAILRIVVPK